MSSVSCISGAKLFSSVATAPAQPARRSVVRISAVADKVAPDPTVVPPNVLECELFSLNFWVLLGTFYIHKRLVDMDTESVRVP